MTSQKFQWAADAPEWYLMPGTYDYELMLSDYQERSGSISVVSHAVTTLSATLPYSNASGVYTPLWAFNNSQVVGISSAGAGSISNQYLLFNNPTFGCTHCGSAPDRSLSPIFYSQNDYTFPSFAGIFLSGTSSYIHVNNPPSFAVATTGGGVTYYLNLQFFDTSHVTLSHAAAIRGWPAMNEISFYVTVPASQNPAPQGDVYVWNSSHDLIMSNDFVAVLPYDGYVSPDQLVLYGGSDNVVWGNTFSDPPGVPFGQTYAGIAEAESGDLIYNNNFSIDNPVVDLPFNFPNVADCLPQCQQSNLSDTGFYNFPHETWNVTPQPASNVANTVNGFPLSGNIMGSGYTVHGGPNSTTQGGNFFWNYGKSPNNRTTIPYVSRFRYTDWSNIFPLGCGTIQAPGAPCGTAPRLVGSYENGMQFGGDYAPIVAIGHTAPPAKSGSAIRGVEAAKVLGGASSPISPIMRSLRADQLSGRWL
jgi:thermopsin